MGNLSLFICSPKTMRLLLILLASSSVFPSLFVFLVISLPARSTKLILPCRVIYTPCTEYSAVSNIEIYMNTIVVNKLYRIKRKMFDGEINLGHLAAGQVHEVNLAVPCYLNSLQIALSTNEKICKIHLCK